MHTKPFITIAAIASLVTLVTGMPTRRDECLMKKSDKGANNIHEAVKVGEKVRNEKICKPQGEGTWTFTMFTELDALLIPEKGQSDGFSGNVPTNSFMIMDNDCILRGAYTPPNNKCGTPWSIKENFLDYVLVVSSVFMGVGDPGLTFNYASGHYESGTKQLDCKDMESGLNKVAACKSGFKVHGGD